MTKNCKVCGQKAHGFHFGAVTCRACAAFFKRALLSKRLRKPCQNQNSCEIFSADKSKYCKICRMSKCLKMGMSGDNVPIQPISSENLKIAISLEKFVGRPSLVLFCDKRAKKRTFVDVTGLVTRASRILDADAPSVLRGSALEKLSMALETTLIGSSNVREMAMVDKFQLADCWASEFLGVATWLTHFDDFQKLPKRLKMQLLQSVWHVFGRLLKLIQTGNLRRQSDEADVERNRNHVWICKNGYFDMIRTKLDVSWITVYPVEHVLYFVGAMNGYWQLEQFVDVVTNLKLSEIELTYMLAQLCFQYAGNRFGGEIRDVTDRFQQTLADDLHEYYMADKKRNANYAPRLASMLKVNQGIQKSIRELREKTHIAHTFDIFTADFSHPDMFIDTGC